jgi:hypothetical protein
MTKGYTPPSRAELQAMREQKTQPALAGPMMEASRRAEVIRSGLTSYAATMDKIADAYRREDWKALGYESFNAYAGGEFGEARLKLTPEQRAQILPAFLAVGMSKRGAAAALGVDDKTIRNDLRGADNSAPRKKPPQVSAVDPVAEFDAKYSQTAADGHRVAPPADGAEEARQSLPAPASGPVPVVSGDGPDVTPSSSVEDPSGSQAEVPSAGVQDSSRADFPAASEAPADRTRDPDGPEAASPAAGQPGMEPPTAMGEAPMATGPSAAGATPRVDDRGAVDRDEVEGETGLSPSTDPAHVVENFTEWADWVHGYDSEALGPLFTDEQLDELRTAVEDLTQFVGALERWRSKSFGTP